MGHPTRPRPQSQRRWACVLGFVLTSGLNLHADPVDDATQKLRHGDYAGAAAMAQAGIKETFATEGLVRVEAEALFAQGKYNEAYLLLRSGIINAPQSIRLRLLQREACLYTNRPTEAAQAMTQIAQILNQLAIEKQITQTPLPPQVLADAGEASLLIPSTDPKTILEQFLDPAQQAKPPVRDAFLAAGRLELDKHDFDLASRSFANGLNAFPGDPDMLAGLAQAFRSDSRTKFGDNAKLALDANPQHVPTLLLLAENLIDAESYDKANQTLDQILKINPSQQAAFALKAAIAYLHNQMDVGDSYRKAALLTWAKNPRVDYIIGQKLSQNYRFSLGEKSESLALASDPKFTPARVQRAQDLLRLGREEEGWKEAALAQQEDAYDIEAFNLVALHDEIAKFTTIASPNKHFTLVMEPLEAKIYGQRVLALLEKARDTVAKKYGLDLNFPVLVEVFPNSADFSVRTFGMPDIGEFLGVTFGPVVTINAPSSHESNWEDVMWHEFTHVVTLTLTKNQMPRWLSEGISVYEEGQANPNWGEHMTPDARDRIRAGKAQPISSMSAAFLQAKGMEDTEFAYYESMLVVQFLVERYGFDHLLGLLHALGDGVEMNDALAKNFAPLAQLDEAFAKYAADQAKLYAPMWDFTAPNAGTGDATAILSFLPTEIANQLQPDTTPPDIAIAPKEAARGGAGAPGDQASPAPKPAVTSNHFYERLGQVHDAINQGDWAKARSQLQEITATGFYLPGPDNPYLLLAKACDQLQDTAAEKTALLTVAAHEGDSLEAVNRLLELAQVDKDWADVVKWGEASIAIHPMAASTWRALFDAREQLRQNPPGVEAGLALLALEPPDLASLNFRVAKLLQPTDADSARRHVLQALEDAPRFRAAYDLLATLPTATPAPASDNPNPSTP